MDPKRPALLTVEEKALRCTGHEALEVRFDLGHQRLWDGERPDAGLGLRRPGKDRAVTELLALLDDRDCPVHQVDPFARQAEQLALP
jgi:hypothetical protein